MPENQTTQPCEAGGGRPCGGTERNPGKDELEAQYRRIGIAAVAAAAGTRPRPRKDGGR